MPTGSAVPVGLQPYFTSLPAQSLILLTSTLNASNTWLLLRYLDALLPPSSSAPPAASSTPPQVVIFVSFLRSWSFWNEIARRINRSLPRALQQGTLVFANSLIHTCSARAPPPPEAAGRDVFLTLRDHSDAGVRALFAEALAAARRAAPSVRIAVLVDGLDFLTAAEFLDVPALLDLVAGIRQEKDVATVVLTAAADAALLQQDQQRGTTPLEQDHRSLVVQLAHQASFVLGTRELASGPARDVAGVLRATKGAVEIEEGEWLYHLKGDGSVTVIERGA